MPKAPDRIFSRHINSGRTRPLSLVPLVFVVLLLSGGEALFTPKASSDISPIPVPTCADAPAQATLNLSTVATYLPNPAITVSSPDATYYYSGPWYCQRYVVDAWVQAAPHGSWAVLAGWAAPIYDGTCSQLTEDVSFYYKTAFSGGFISMGSGHFVGASKADGEGGTECVLVQTQGTLMKNPDGSGQLYAHSDWPARNPQRIGLYYFGFNPTFFGMTIRVAALVKWAGSAKVVTVCGAQVLEDVASADYAFTYPGGACYLSKGSNY